MWHMVKQVAPSGRLDYAAYQSKVGEVANRLCLLQIDKTLRPTAVGSRGDAPQVEEYQGRDPQAKKSRRALRKPRALSAAGKARTDLQIKMLAAIPAKARGEFVKELADHARKYPSSGRYLHNLADQGNEVAGEVVARLGGER